MRLKKRGVTVESNQGNGGEFRVEPAVATLPDGAMEVEVEEHITIHEVKWGHLKLKLTGTAPYMQHRMSAKTLRSIMDKHEAGSQTKKGQAREKRNFDQEFQEAKYLFPDGSSGIPAGTFRNSMVSACKLCGYKMTHAKLSLFIEADGLDAIDATPLIKIHGKVEKSIMPVRIGMGIFTPRIRPMWREWSAVLKIKFDTSQFSSSDIFNLVNRAGQQVGIGEGRPDSEKSNGIGFGTFLATFEGKALHEKKSEVGEMANG